MSAVSVLANPSGTDATDYVAALLGLLGTDDPVDVLQATPEKIATLAAGQTSERLRRAEAPGKWSVTQVLAHMADGEMVFGCRLRWTLAEEEPALVGYDQDAWARSLHYERAEVDRSLRCFSVLRETNVALMRELSPTEWDRVGRHAERGNESVRHMVRMYAGHDRAHIRQIGRILAAGA